MYINICILFLRRKYHVSMQYVFLQYIHAYSEKGKISQPYQRLFAAWFCEALYVEDTSFLKY